MDEQKATDAGPEAPTKRKGRPPGGKRKATDRELIEQLAARIDSLQGDLEKAKATAIDPATVTLPPEVEQVKPGTILSAGKDQRGDPIYFKKTWTRGDMERMYEKRTFTPQWTVPVTVQRVTYQLVAGQEITVPSIIKDVYESRMRIQHMDYAAAYPAPDPNQVYQINEAARRQPGTRVFSPLHFLNTGINVHTETPEEAPEPTKES